MASPTKIVSHEQLQKGLDSVLGIDPTQAPTDPEELNSRLTTPQSGITEAISFLLAQQPQQTRNLRRALPITYAMLEAATLAFPEEMGEEIKSKAFVTSIASVAPEARAAVAGDSASPALVKERQPQLVAFLEEQLLGPESFAQKLSLDDRTGLYALCLGTVRAIDRHLQGAEKPVVAVKEPGRNEPCHCGSGKKFKKCHGAPGATAA